MVEICVALRKPIEALTLREVPHLKANSLETLCARVQQQAMVLTYLGQYLNTCITNEAVSYAIILLVNRFLIGHFCIFGKNKRTALSG